MMEDFYIPVRGGKTYLDWKKIEFLIEHLASTIEKSPTVVDSVYGLPRGGLIPAVMLSHRLGVPLITEESLIGKNTVVVDDIADSGDTLSKYSGNLTATLLYKPHTSCFTPTFLSLRFNWDDWVVFPWERKDSLPDR